MIKGIARDGQDCAHPHTISQEILVELIRQKWMTNKMSLAKRCATPTHQKKKKSSQEHRL